MPTMMNISDAYESSSDGEDSDTTMSPPNHQRRHTGDALLSSSSSSRGGRGGASFSLPSLPRRAAAGAAPSVTAFLERFRATQPRVISALVCICLFLWVFSGTVLLIPAMQMSEKIICRMEYGPDVDLDTVDGSALCKSEKIQSKMAYIFGLSLAFNSIVGAMAALPFGILADHARQSVYFLASAGHFISVAWTIIIFGAWRVMPIWLVLIGPFFQFIGGGLPVAIAILFSIISDSQTSENKAIAYFYASLAAQAASFLATPCASFLMGIGSAWLPLYLSLFCVALAGLLILFIPDTTVTNLSEEDDDSNMATSAGGTRSRSWWSILRSKTKEKLRSTRTSFLESKTRPVLLIMFVFVCVWPVAIGLGPTFIQYVSKRHDKSIQEAGYILAVRGIFSLGVMAIGLPGLSKLLTSTSSPSSRFCGLSPMRKDLVLARASAAVSALGFLVMASPGFGVMVAGMILETLGNGMPPLCRSLITEFVEPGQTASLFTLISLVESIGGLPTGPILAWTFSTGMKVKGFWYGLPFYFLALVCLGAFTALCCVKLPKEGYQAVRQTDEDSLDGYASEYSMEDPI